MKKLMSWIFILMWMVGCGSVSDTPHVVMKGRMAQLLKPISTQQINDFVTTLERHLQDREYVSATQLIETWPELASRTMMQSSSRQMAYPSRRFIARQLDSMLSMKGKPHSFTALIEQIDQYSDEWDQQLNLLNKAWSELASANPDGAKNILESAQSQNVIHFDVKRLLLTSMVLLGEHEQAIVSINSMIENSQNTWKSVQWCILLLQTLQSTNVDTKQYQEKWEEAVASATQTLSGNRYYKDPMLWQQLIELMPARAIWPMNTRLHMARAGDVFTNILTDESIDGQAVVSTIIGNWYIERQQPSQALLQLKQAESLMPRGKTDGILLLQAKALMGLNQGGAGSAILGDLVQKNSEIKNSALALLAVWEIRENRVRIGLSLLKKAIDGSQGKRWYGSAQAQADLALAYLLVDDRQKGLEHFKIAQAEFERQGDYVELITLLKNKASYYSKTGIGRASAVYEEIAKIEMTAK